MFTQCPQCETTFRVLAAQLKAAKGKVRCGECGNTFDALENLMDPGRAAAAAASATEQARAYRQAASRAPAQSPAEEPASTPQTQLSHATQHTAGAEGATRGSPAPRPATAEIRPAAGKEPTPRTSDGDGGTLPGGSPGEDFTHDPFGADHIKSLFSEDPAPSKPDDGAPGDMTSGLESWSATRSGGLDAEPPANEPPANKGNAEPSRERSKIFDARQNTARAAPATPDRDASGGRTAESEDTPAGKNAGRAQEVAPAYVLPPELDDEPVKRRLLPTAIWTIGTLLLAALLLGQYAHHEAAALATRYDEARPWLERLCAYTNCRLPPRRNLAAIEMTTNTVQSHPRYQKSLLITATLVNRAPFAQPYPDVEILMTDLQQQAVARRRFTPEQYLAEAHKATFEPGDAAHLILEVTDPGPSAVSFEFNFH